MKFKKSIVLAATILGCNLAHADAKNFEGLSANIGAYAVSSSMSFNFAGSGAVVEGLGASSYAVDLSVDYGIALSPNTVLLLGGTYGLSDPTMAKVSGTGTDLDGTLKAGDRMSAFAAPGITISEKVLAYGKIAYVSTKPSGTDSMATTYKTHSGFGYGGGVRVLLDSNLYLNFEAMNNDYGSKVYEGSKVSGQGLFAGLALGYKF